LATPGVTADKQSRYLTFWGCSLSGEQGYYEWLAKQAWL
jgi:hypothetical protein